MGHDQEQGFKSKAGYDVEAAVRDSPCGGQLDGQRDVGITAPADAQLHLQALAAVLANRDGLNPEGSVSKCQLLEGDALQWHLDGGVSKIGKVGR